MGSGPPQHLGLCPRVLADKRRVQQKCQWVNNLGTALDHGRGAGRNAPASSPLKRKDPDTEPAGLLEVPSPESPEDEPHLHEHSLFLSTCSSGEPSIPVSLLPALPATPEITVQIILRIKSCLGLLMGKTKLKTLYNHLSSCKWHGCQFSGLGFCFLILNQFLNSWYFK